MTSNGSAPDFTHRLESFTVEGHTFTRRKVRAREWAETLSRVASTERAEMEKTEGSLLFAVSEEGLFELISLAIRPEDMDVWNKLWEDGKLEFGELADLRDWIWEQMTARPFTSDTPSSDGLGTTSEASSRDASLSQAEVLTG